ncbi:MAG: MarR family winged helix-turn-helix transcriptional regulator [Roseinatronobacter sp.]
MTPSAPLPEDDLADLIVHLAKLGQSGGHASDEVPLTTAQWTALRYFARANRISRTPSAFSDFQATTRGTASQTVKSLVALGFLRKQSHDHDGRSTLIEVTETGLARLDSDPLRDLRTVLRDMPSATRSALSQALGAAIFQLAKLRDAPIFGTCSACQYCGARDYGRFCTLSQMALSAQDMQAICADFQPIPNPDTA